MLQADRSARSSPFKTNLEDMMRALRFTHLAFLTILVSASGSLYAQDGKPQEPKQPRQEEARPESRQDQMNEPRDNQMKPARQDEAKPSKQDKKEQKQEEKQSHEQMKQNDQMKQSEHMKQNEQGKDNRQMSAQQNSTAHARPAGKSAHIPDDKFHSNFGRSHTVKVQRTTVVEGQPGFVYGGYSFVFVDPWPAEWAYSDDCYVDYIDGEYFLFDLLHPGVRIALFVVE